MIEITIDDKKIEVAPETTLVDAARQAGAPAPSPAGDLEQRLLQNRHRLLTALGLCKLQDKVHEFVNHIRR